MSNVESSVFTSRAVVYVVDPVTRGWVASAVAGFTRLDIYVHSGTGAARVIGRSQEDPNKIVINSNITKDTLYTKARDTFHQWSDARGAFGLNFSTAQEADAFAVAFEGAKVPQGGAAAPQPQAPVPKPAPPPAKPPQAPAPTPVAKPAAPPAPLAKAAGGGPPPPPAPPKAPPKPPPTAAPSGDAPPERNALLDSIQGFSKGGLKKTVTVDKSGPVTANKPASAGGAASLTRKEASDAGGAGAGAGAGAAPAASFGGNDMMAEMMRKRNAMANKTAAPTPAPVEPAAPKPAPPSKAAPVHAPKPAPTAKPTPPPAGNKPSVPSAMQTAQSAPSFARPPSASHEAPVISSSSGSSGELPEHLQLLKEAIMTEIRAELAQFKAEILEHLQR